MVTRLTQTEADPPSPTSPTENRQKKKKKVVSSGNLLANGKRAR